ncbi:MAG: hypothetical protein ABIR37_02410 [Candidatus Saccharimonadales bacterium]
MGHGFVPMGARGHGFGPIGERALDRGVRPTPTEVSAQLAALHATEEALGQVVVVDFSLESQESTVSEQAV